LQKDCKYPSDGGGWTHRARVDSLGRHLESDVELVLKALGHPEALVTDLSTVGDFGLDAEERCAASAKLGVTLSDDDYIHEVAQRLRNKL